MKVKDGFYLTAIGTDFVIIASTPETKKEFDGMLRLNETGAFLWKKLADGASETELADALAAEYGVSRELSDKDTAGFVSRVIIMLPFLMECRDSVRLVSLTDAPRKYDIVLYRVRD